MGSPLQCYKYVVSTIVIANVAGKTDKFDIPSNKVVQYQGRLGKNVKAMSKLFDSLHGLPWRPSVSITLALRNR